MGQLEGRSMLSFGSAPLAQGTRVGSEKIAYFGALTRTWALHTRSLDPPTLRRLPLGSGAICQLETEGVEIELAQLVIRPLLVQYLSFSSTLMLSSMHHTDTHIL
jgi:hypothetical protein